MVDHGVVVRVPLIRPDSRISYATRTFDFHDLAVIPETVIRAAWKSKASLMWEVLRWGLPREQFDVLDDMPMKAVQARVKAWEKSCKITLDEIVGVLTSIDKHGIAIEADLIDKGLRLRNFPSPDNTWRDLFVILKMSGPHSSFYKVANPEGGQWDLHNFLLAEAVDVLRWLQWAKTENAKDPTTIPKPITRPGVGGEEKGAGSIRGRKMPLDKAKKRFGREDPDRVKKLHNLFR